MCIFFVLHIYGYIHEIWRKTLNLNKSTLYIYVQKKKHNKSDLPSSSTCLKNRYNLVIPDTSNPPLASENNGSTAELRSSTRTTNGHAVTLNTGTALISFWVRVQLQSELRKATASYKNVWDAGSILRYKTSDIQAQINATSLKLLKK